MQVNSFGGVEINLNREPRAIFASNYSPFFMTSTQKYSKKNLCEACFNDIECTVRFSMHKLK